MPEKLFTHTMEVVGLGFRVKSDVRRVLAGRTNTAPMRVAIEREPDNKSDPNAIRVIVAVGALKGKHIGYLRADTAALLAPLMDAGHFVFKSAKLTGLYQDDDFKSGILEVTFRDKRPKTA